MGGNNFYSDIGVVYFVQCSVTKLIKIGFSTNFETRYSDLQHGHASKLDVLGTVRGRWDDEQNLHKRFDDCRAHGEWFYPVKSLLRLISFAYSSPTPWQFNDTMAQLPEVSEVKNPRPVSSANAVMNVSEAAAYIGMSKAWMK